MSPPEFRLLTPEEVDRAPEIRRVWNSLVENSRNLRVLYQSPVWWDCCRDGAEGKVFLAALSDSRGILVGLCPVQLTDASLTVHLFGRISCRIPLKTLEVMGEMPLLPNDESLHIRFFQGLLDSLPEIDGLVLKHLRSNGFGWSLCRESRPLRSQMLVYAPEAVGPYHTITLAPTFREYLSKFKPNTRRKLEGRVRRLRDEGGGRLDLVRIESACDVEHFVDAAAAIAEHTWQKRRLDLGIDKGAQYGAFLRRCAENGILRSYLLRCGDSYCCFVIGYQLQGVYYYVQIGFDERWARFSPGTVQLFLLLEDVIRYRPAQRLDFGHGDWDFKRLFGTEHLDEASALLLKKTLLNRFRVASHASCYGLVRGLKRLLRRSRN
jgi:hypothetical protein